MIIKSISLKNFKSFGNNKQSVNFNTTTGELVLITAPNGHGKTSLQQSIDFAIFGIVRGKNGKRLPQTILPNRTNKNLETEIEFINNLSDTIKIQRNLEPNLAKIFINDNDETKKFKILKKEDRDKTIGFDFETYKNFISMSVSDFANFIDLTPEEKRNIINKLFNLQDLDNYFNITNGLIKQAKEERLKYETIITTNNQTISTLNQNIITIKRTGIVDKEKEIQKLETEKLSKKQPYLTSKEQIDTCNKQLIEIEKQRQDFSNQRDVINNEILEIKVNIRNLEEKLEIYQSGKCPFCDTDLKDEEHTHNLEKLNIRLEDLNQKFDVLDQNKNSILLKLTQISNQKDTVLKQKTNANVTLNNLVYELKLITKKIVDLKESKDNISIDELNKNIEELDKNNLDNKSKIDKIDLNLNIYDELKEVFSNKGVRKSIIKTIVKPINVYLKDILDELKSQYNVKIDEEFNVFIYERLTNEVHPESLSMGESKKINIAIALSYLKLILKFRKLNILFLDEVFSSMEPENVDLALKVLKNFTKEFNLNIIILDPKVYFTENNSNIGIFDRIIKITKKLGFSTIEEKRI